MTYLFFLGIFAITFLALSLSLFYMNRQLSINNMANLFSKKVMICTSFIFSLVFSFISFLDISKDFLLYNNAKWFGRSDPIFGQDVSYYVFKRPFLMDLYHIAFMLLISLLIITFVLYFINLARNGKLREFSKNHRIFMHITILVSLVFLVKALTFKFSAENMLFRNNENYVGLGYIENKIWIPYYNLAPFLIVFLLFGILLFGFFKKQKPALIFILVYPVCFFLFSLASYVINTMYVVPNEAFVESSYVKTSMNWTKHAYGIDTIENRAQENIVFDYDEYEKSRDQKTTDYDGDYALKKVRKQYSFLNIDEEYVKFGSDEYIFRGLTSTDMYPLSATVLGNNYYRNSAIVIYDAKKDTMKCYVIDTTDPIIQCYKSIYPELFTNLVLPKEIKNATKFSKYFFDVQSQIMIRYNTDNAMQFYQKDNIWEILKTTAGNSEEKTSEAQVMQSYYDDQGNLKIYYTHPDGTKPIALLIGLKSGGLQCIKQASAVSVIEEDNTPTVTDITLRKRIEEIVEIFEKYQKNLKNSEWEKSGKSFEELEKRVEELKKI